MDKEYDERLELRLQEYEFTKSDSPVSAKNVIPATVGIQEFPEAGQPWFTDHPEKSLH